jgi:hypothetical protein
VKCPENLRDKMKSGVIQLIYWISLLPGTFSGVSDCNQEDNKASIKVAVTQCQNKFKTRPILRAFTKAQICPSKVEKA